MTKSGKINHIRELYRYKIPILCRGDVHGAMAAVPSHGLPTGVLQRCHSLNSGITVLTKYPPEKQIPSHWPMETLCMDSPLVPVADLGGLGGL